MTKCRIGNCPDGKDMCCMICPDKDACDGACDLTPGKDFQGICPDALLDEQDTQAALVAFQDTNVSTLRKIADLVTVKKKLEEEEKALKDSLKKAMEAYCIKSFDSDILKITYIAATTATSIDSAKLKKKYPAIADECSKTSPKTAYVKVEVKGGDKK